LCNIIIICVPTPLTRQREPDLSFIEATAETISAHLQRGQAIVLESTTYPGTTTEVVRPALEKSGLRSGIDFLLGFSPEREDPGNLSFKTANTPKVVSGDGPDALETIRLFYSAVTTEVVTVSSTAVAEAVKITENVFRSVNIALVNELKLIYAAMGIDVWEVIEAARTKPFGFMAFYPGPGLGGHCIPIDPFYLTWKARAYGVPTRFIELAGEINTAMPRHVVQRLAEELDRRRGLGLRGRRVLVLGVAYKRNVDDTRESPGLEIIELLQTRGAEVAYHDPHVAAIPPTRRHAGLAGLTSEPLTRERLAGLDAALVITDHAGVDYALVADACPLVIDTRNVVPRGPSVTQA
ncbi:MAG TPA: nucleotide sugar dehydrogenase, partial [Thermoanaerobaculia bacterium]|nr:nucleotide sugar dehydrogenase [Thermoanaerobaculia bacterium]